MDDERGCGFQPLELFVPSRLCNMEFLTAAGAACQEVASLLVSETPYHLPLGSCFLGEFGLTKEAVKEKTDCKVLLN